MISINDYIKQTIMFTNSLVIKSLGTALAMNRYVLLSTNLAASADKTTWKYFMNISGKKHFTNNDVQVFVIETGKKEPLSKEILEKYPTTKKELLSNGSYYNDLIEEYPNDRLFIHGCLYPVDINKAISAADGTILNYNGNYIESNEYSLIKELNEFTTNFFKRWYIKEFTLVDELYMATILANLYVAIPNKIINIRLSKVLTPEVHSFHMEHFFRSNLDIWDAVQVLTPASKMWLYKNLRYLKHNIGKNGTFNTIIEKIFNANSVGLGSYVIRNKDVELNKQNKYTNSTSIPVTDPVYTRPTNILSGTKLNSYYEADNNKSIDIETVVNLELDMLKKKNGLLTFADREKYIVSNALKSINSSVLDKQNTKIVEFSSSKLFKMYGSDIYKIILDHWVYFIQNNIVEYTIEYVDPNTNKIYSVNPKTALLIMLKYLLYITRNPTLKLTNLNYNYVLNPNSDILYSILYKMHEDGLTDKIVNMLSSLYPKADKYISNIEETCEYIKDSVAFYTACWFLDANSASVAVSANIKHILQLATLYGTYKLTDNPEGETIDSMLDKYGIDIEITEEYDIIAAIQSLFKAAVLIDVDAQSEMDNSISLYIDLLSKLTSYTVQSINSKTEEEKIFVYYNNTDIYRTMNGILQVEDGYMVPYDRTHIAIKGYANAFVDGMSSEVVDTDMPTISTAEWPIRGYMININTWYSWIDPILILEIHDYPVVDVSDLEFYDDFITAAVSRVSPYDKSYVPTKGIHNKIADRPVIQFAGTGTETEDEFNIYPWDPNKVSGYGFITNSDTVSSDNMLTIEIEEII